MDSLMIFSALAKLVFAAAALLLVFFFLRWLDRRGKLKWLEELHPLMRSEPMAAAVYYGSRFLGASILVGLAISGAVVLAIVPAPAIAGPLIPSTYDKPIKASAERYLPGVPPKLLKAQLYQESRLEPSARSPVGAEGIGQFMPATWVEVTKAMGLGLVDRRLAEPSIAAAGYYMAQLRRRWVDVADLERHRFAAAGYNAGNGSIGRARRACDGAPVWAEVAACLPSITGRHALETTTYVDRIWRWWAQLEARA